LVSQLHCRQKLQPAVIKRFLCSLESWQQRGMEMYERYIVAATGLGYLIVGLLQAQKGSLSNALIWVGYAAAQIGLWMNLK
jgi:hypothetical protein